MFKFKILTVQLLLAISLANLSDKYSFAQNSVLKGVVSHSVNLSEVPEFLRSGELIDKNALKEQKPKFEWYKIPNSLAGKWDGYKSKLIKTTKPDSVDIGLIQTNETNLLLGTQTDRNGNIWQCVYYPKISYVNLNATTQNYLRSLTTFEKIIDSDDETITFLARTIDNIVDRKTNRIIKTYQKESIYNVMLMSDTIIRVAYSDKFFNDDGSASYESEREVLFLKKAEFKPEEFGPSNYDFRKSFIAYLKHYSLNNLIPE